MSNNQFFFNHPRSCLPIQNRYGWWGLLDRYYVLCIHHYTSGHTIAIIYVSCKHHSVVSDHNVYSVCVLLPVYFLVTMMSAPITDCSHFWSCWPGPGKDGVLSCGSLASGMAPYSCNICILLTYKWQVFCVFHVFRYCFWYCWECHHKSLL